MIYSLIISVLLAFPIQKEPGVAISLDGKAIKGNEISLKSIKKGKMTFKVVNAEKVFPEDPFYFDFILARGTESLVQIQDHNLDDPFNLVEDIKKVNADATIQKGDRILLQFENVQAETSLLYQFTIVE